MLWMLNFFHCRPDVLRCNFSATEPHRNNHNLVTILLIFAGSWAVTDTGGKTISPKHEQNTSKYTNEQDQPPTYDQALRQYGEHSNHKNSSHSAEQHFPPKYTEVLSLNVWKQCFTHCVSISTVDVCSFAVFLLLHERW